MSCKSLTQKGKQCGNFGTYDGYCHHHRKSIQIEDENSAETSEETTELTVDEQLMIYNDIQMGFFYEKKAECEICCHDVPVSHFVHFECAQNMQNVLVSNKRQRMSLL